MASYIPPAFIQELLSHIDIVEVIKNRIQLSHAGTGQYKALCPFHHEKTPSFTVSQSKQFYYCFGCSESGNAIGFLMAYEKLNFPEAIKQLALQAGLSIPQDHQSPYEKQKNKVLAEQAQLLEEVTQYYQNQLKKNADAQAYLKNTRQLSPAIIEHYQIGYAPNSWHHLTQDFVQNNPRKKSALIHTGMLIKKETYYNFFKGRLIFPIRRARDGKVIGFGGRTLQNQEPKYLNSPNTPLFDKGKELYGLYEAHQANKKLNYVLVVEGYMDVVSLAQFGITCGVAALGTAFSIQHFYQLQRYTKHIIFCFDGDHAGYRAACRALATTLPKIQDELKIQFMFLPKGEDPDTLIRKEGYEAFIQRIKKAIYLTDFFFEHLKKQYPAQTIEGRANLAQGAKALLDKMPNGIFKSLMIQQLATLLNIPTHQITHYLSQIPKIKERETNYAQATPPSHQPIKNRGVPPKLSTHLKILTFLLQKPALISALNSIPSYTASPQEKLLIEIAAFIKKQPNLTTGAIVEAWRERPAFDLIKKLAAWPISLPEKAWENEVVGLMKQLKQRYQKIEIQRWLDKAQKSGLAPDELHTLQQLIKKSKATE